MKIIYGLSGQGFGHSTRSKETIKHLLDAGHEVKILTYGQALFMLRDFSDRIIEIPGLILVYKKNRLSYFQTVFQNTKKILTQAKDWKKLKKIFADFNPDLVITDFEPLTAKLAKEFRRPLISIDNQHQLTNTKIKITAKYKKDLLTDRLIVKSMIGHADYYLITSFFKTPISQKNTFLFPPVIRQEILDLQPVYGDYILVYDGSDLSSILPALQSSAYQFIVVGPDKEGRENNIIYKKYSVDEWLKLLQNAKAMIGTAGLSLLGECIYLKKPYLALPIERQIEQVVNAEYLKRLGGGDFTYKLTAEKIKEFMGQWETYRKNLSEADGCGNELLFKKLDEIINNYAKA